MTAAPRIDRLEQNLLINSGFDFSQRGNLAGAAISTTPGFENFDRWYLSYSGTASGTPLSIRSSSQLPNTFSQYACNLSIQRNASAATLRWEQRIESLNMLPLISAAMGSFSGQFLPTFGINTGVVTAQLTLNTPNSVDSYGGGVTQIYQSSLISLNPGQWNLVSLSGIPLSGNLVNGMSVVWTLNIPSATDGSNVSNFFTQAMVNAGPNSSAWARYGRSYGEELSLCQRYYEKSYDLDTTPGTITTVGESYSQNASSVQGAFTVYYKVTKRTHPVVVVFSPNTGTNGVGWDQTAGPDFPFSVDQNALIGWNGRLTGLAAAGHDLYVHWAVDADF